ncbi:MULTISPECIES: Fur-regulated basic protein FbpA [Gracilibacillus]|uniref:Fur-regulated basic protein FbpA n=1 Tax=Gracilibacillus dipsosauri TaxID=178340 RepID=A0A317L2E6_9BACI|nr:Fur-regulated basic protein FbpA [Gracilibacillus dipsosauri]PWU69693.1 Fur-regulated basic protein FbpA [Gracilibacillus dipsosauri]
MAFLREAVEKQKIFLIEQLIASGVVKEDNQELYNKPISEIVHDYEKFCLELDRTTQNSFKFTRYNPERQEEKPDFH